MNLGLKRKKMKSLTSTFILVLLSLMLHSQELDEIIRKAKQTKPGFFLVENCMIPTDKLEKHFKKTCNLSLKSKETGLYQQNGRPREFVTSFVFTESSQLSQAQSEQGSFQKRMTDQGFTFIFLDYPSYLAVRFFGSYYDSLEIISSKYMDFVVDGNGNGVIYTTKSAGWSNFITFDGGTNELKVKNGKIVLKISSLFP